MTPEEFQKIKEAEKEHLRALKKLKQAVRGIEQRNKVTKAVTDIASSTSSLLSEHENLVEKLAHETALQEARLELAMESAAERSDVKEEPEGLSALDLAAESEKINEDLAKKRAADLVKEMKSQMGADLPSRTTTPASTPIDHSAEKAVEKTIGRRVDNQDSAPEESNLGSATSENAIDSAESDVPEKTIGRVKRNK